MELPSNFSNVTCEDGKVYGRHNTVTSVNPYNCYFIVLYPDGRIIKGNNLFKTGWDNIPNGISELSFYLSTGHIIKIPKYKAYMPLIECSVGMDGSRIFHSINVKCLGDNNVIVNRIILKQDTISDLKIGDVVLGKEKIPSSIGCSWKYSS